MESYILTFETVLLLLESAANFPSVGLLNKEGDLVWHKVSDLERSHAEMLPVFANEGLQVIQERHENLSAVAVNKGPLIVISGLLLTKIFSGLNLFLRVFSRFLSSGPRINIG